MAYPSSCNYQSSAIFKSLLLLSLLSSTYSQIYNGYELWDLDSSDSDFSTQAASWIITDQISSSNATQCSNSWILGGYQIVDTYGSFSKTYASLPSHTAIQFSLSFWILDVTQASNLFQIYFDSQLVGTWDSNFYVPNTNQYQNSCGGPNQDLPNFLVEGNVPHVSASLTFKVLSMYNSASDTFSVGFRDIHLLFTNSSSTPSACEFSTASSLSTQPSCFCGIGNYSLAGSSSCYSCSSACQNCIGPQTSDCTACASGYSFIQGACTQCDSTCAICSDNTKNGCVRCSLSSSYLYFDGSCQTNCTSPLVSTSSGGVNYCVSPCSSSEYLYENGACLGICLPPFVQVVQGNTKFCNMPCPVPQYLSWDGSCSSSCPLIYQIINNTVSVCNFQCPQGQYAYWNNTCSTSCDSPLIKVTDSNGSDHCSRPCKSEDYLLTNGSCTSFCSRANQTTSDGVLLCLDVCQSSEYMYWNGTCLPSCNSPFQANTTTGYNNTCSKPCNDGSYLLANGTCIDQCSFINETTSDGVMYCLNPCQQNKYLYANNSCLDTCISPHIATTPYDNFSLCNPPCPGGEYYDENGHSCLSRCDSPQIIKQEDGYKTCKNGPVTPSSGNSSDDGSLNNPNVHAAVRVIAQASAHLSAATNFIRTNDTDSVFMIALAKLVKYVKYLDLDLPDYVENVFETSDSLSFSIPTSFTINMPSSLQDQLPKQPLPDVFASQGIHSSYLVNQWSNLSAFLIFGAAGICFAILEVALNKSKKLKIPLLIVSKFRMITKWNMLSFLFFNSYDDLTFYAIIEFRTLHIDSFWTAVSFLTCLVTTSIAIYLLINVVMISMARMKKIKEIRAAHLAQQAQEEKEANEEKEHKEDLRFYKRWEPHQVLHSGFQEETLIKKLCLLILTIQPIFYYLIIGLLFEHPLVQTVLLTLVTLLIIAYLFKERPIRDRFNFFVAMVYELICLLVNVTLLTLAILNHMNIAAPKFRVEVYNVILFSNMLINLLANVFLWMYLILGIKDAYKISTQKGLNKKLAWLNILVVPYQNPGMDFDEQSNEAFGESILSEGDAEAAKRGGFRKISPIMAKSGFIVSPKSELDILNGSSKSPMNNINLSGMSPLHSPSGILLSGPREVKIVDLEQEGSNPPSSIDSRSPSNSRAHSVTEFRENLKSSLKFKIKQRTLQVKRSNLATQTRIATMLSNIDRAVTPNETGEPQGSLLDSFEMLSSSALHQRRNKSDKHLRVDILRKATTHNQSTLLKIAESTQDKNSSASSRGSDAETESISSSVLIQTAESPDQILCNIESQSNFGDSPSNTINRFKRYAPLRSSKKRFMSSLFAIEQKDVTSIGNISPNEDGTIKDSHIMLDEESATALHNKGLLNGTKRKGNNSLDQLEEEVEDDSPPSIVRDFFRSGTKA